jgi:hypothetical protein
VWCKRGQRNSKSQTRPSIPLQMLCHFGSPAQFASQNLNSNSPHTLTPLCSGYSRSSRADSDGPPVEPAAAPATPPSEPLPSESLRVMRDNLEDGAVGSEGRPHLNNPPYQASCRENSSEQSAEEMDRGSSASRATEPSHYPMSTFSGTYSEPKSRLTTPVSYTKPCEIDTRDQSYVLRGPSLPTGVDYRGISSTDVIFSYYGFLESDLLSRISPQDVNFLESQDCFRIPTRPALDEFVREYFLHVHPNLPMINEATFWEMYTHQGYYPSERPRLSLFVFQAMLFASCSVSCKRFSALSLFADANLVRIPRDHSKSRIYNHSEC